MVVGAKLGAEGRWPGVKSGINEQADRLPNIRRIGSVHRSRASAEPPAQLTPTMYWRRAVGGSNLPCLCDDNYSGEMAGGGCYRRERFDPGRILLRHTYFPGCPQTWICAYHLSTRRTPNDLV